MFLSDGFYASFFNHKIIQLTRIPSIDPMLIIREGEEGVDLAVNNGKHLIKDHAMNHPSSLVRFPSIYLRL